MKEQRGNITQEERRVLSEDTMEQVTEDGMETNSIGAESRDNLDRGEQHYTRECHLVHGNSRSHLRADSVPMEGFGDMSDGLLMPKISPVNTSEDDFSQEIVEKWALDNAPAPIKVQVEAETSEESTLQELSPPPSPKRMREVARKGNVFSQGSI